MRPQTKAVMSGLLAMAVLVWLLLPGAVRTPITSVQTPGQTGPYPVPTDAAGQPVLSAGTPIYSSEGERIGEVSKVVMAPNEWMQAIWVDVPGPLGIGQKTVVMSVDEIDKVGDRIVTKLTPAEIRSLPAATTD